MSLAVSPSSSPKPDESDDEYEYEYEEIEEEIEVEEEVEEEIDDDEQQQQPVEEDCDPQIENDDVVNTDEFDEDNDRYLSEFDNGIEIEDDAVKIDEFNDDRYCSDSDEFEQDKDDPQICAAASADDDDQPNDSNQSSEIEEHEDQKQPDFETSETCSKPSNANLVTVESVDGFVVPDPSENASSQVKGEIIPGENDAEAVLEKTDDVIDVKRELLIRDADGALRDDASKEIDDGNLSVVAENEPPAFEVEDMQISPTPSPRLHVPQIRTRDSSASAEFEGGNKKQKIMCEFYAKGWCIKGDTCRYLHEEGLDATVKKSEDTIEASSNAGIRENPNLNGDDGKSIFHNGSVSRSVGEKSYADNQSNYISPLAKSNLIDRTHHMNFSGSTSDYHHHYASIGLKDRRFSDLSFSHPRQSSSFGWNMNTLGPHKLLENNLERRASIPSSVQLSASPFSYYEPENILRNRIFKEPSSYKAKTSTYNWEPSVPFRPSHVITTNILAKAGLYDPLHDTIEQTRVRDWLEKPSNSGQGSSMLNAHVQSNNLETDDKPLTSANVGDTGKLNVISSSDDNRLHLEKTRDQTELKVDESHVNHEMGNVFKKEGHMQNQETALKNFQAALIEHVKELVKPTWREGLMSKDAHKLIVKKSVDKVLSTLQPEQVPNTPESIKFYLSSSHSKLVNLVEGYIEKYGKS